MSRTSHHSIFSLTLVTPSTARALAGMLQQVRLRQFRRAGFNTEPRLVSQVGLLLPGNEQSVTLAYSIYSGKDKWLVEPQCGKADCTECGELLADAFKRSFCRDIHVHFVSASFCQHAISSPTDS